MNIGFIFPGQGSQFVGMGKSFYDNCYEAKELFDIASDVLKLDIKNILFNENNDINLTKYTQPSVLLVSYIAYSLFIKSSNISPIFALGHSLGEIIANVASGSILYADSINLVYKRGELMQKACNNIDAGMAAVIGLDDNKLEEFVSSNNEIWIANYNSEGQSVIAGSKSTLIKIEDSIKNLGAKRYLMLPMSISSHCPLLNCILDEFRDLLKNVIIDNFNFKIISNVNIKPYNSSSTALDLLTMQLVKPVMYKQSVKEYECSVDCFIEFGSNVLKGLNKRIISKPTYSITDMTSLENTLKEINI